MPTWTEGNLSPFSAREHRFAVIVSRYNSFISERLLEGALEALKEHGAREENVFVYRVPGAFELPQAARKIAATHRFSAIVCLGTLLRGETLHFEIISQECARGLQQVSADFLIPVTFGVITADTIKQAEERSGSRSSNKGWEAAYAAMEMAELFEKVAEENVRNSVVR